MFDKIASFHYFSNILVCLFERSNFIGITEHVKNKLSKKNSSSTVELENSSSMGVELEFYTIELEIFTIELDFFSVKKSH